MIILTCWFFSVAIYLQRITRFHIVVWRNIRLRYRRLACFGNRLIKRRFNFSTRITSRHRSRVQPARRRKRRIITYNPLTYLFKIARDGYCLSSSTILTVLLRKARLVLRITRYCSTPWISHLRGVTTLSLTSTTALAIGSIIGRREVSKQQG